MRTMECGYAGGGMWVGYILKCGSWVQRFKKGRNTRRKTFLLDRKNRGNGCDT
jgi:hypothetical protein